MKSYSLYSEIEEEFTFPSAPEPSSVSAKVIYEWGGEIGSVSVSEDENKATVTIPGDAISASGSYYVRWSALIGESQKHFESSFLVEERYIDEEDFFNIYEDLNIAQYSGVVFNQAEKISRGIIDTFCGQNFQFIGNKTLFFEGNGKNKMYLGKRLSHLDEVSVDRGDGLLPLESAEIDWASRYSISSVDKFTAGARVSVSGDWGWSYPPSNIKTASSLLTLDLMEDSRRESHTYGIVRMEQDTNRVVFDPRAIFESTGNIDVDVLLMDYVYWVPEWI
jgi:hypothetical protein